MLPNLLLLLFLISSFLPLSTSQSSAPRRTLLNCGSNSTTLINGLEYIPDSNFITVGSPKTLSIPNLSSPLLSTVRSFPLLPNHKFCYVIPVYRDSKYLVRTTYFYGGVNGPSFPSPPVFDQVLDGTLWSVVNTTQDYEQGMATIYEGVFLAQGKTMSLCIAANSYTESYPFISALEFVTLSASVYNSTNFNDYGLSLVGRSSFGYNGSAIRYPDDEYDRIWWAFGEDMMTGVSSNRNVSVSGIWNLPPLKVFQTKVTTGPSSSLHLNWPPVSLPSANYYIALYFADDGDSIIGGSRKMFNVSINGVMYYQNLSVTQEGAVVFAKEWPLKGLTTLTLSPAAGSSVRPLINAGEVFTVMVLGGRTLTRDVIALVNIKSMLHNPPIDWSGDPCLPSQYSWTGVTCSEGTRIRVVTLNLTSMGLSGSLSPSIANLTALSDIWLGNNSLSGTLPEFGSLKLLERLHLEDNKFSGQIPSSLGNIKGLRELSNNLDVGTAGLPCDPRDGWWNCNPSCPSFVFLQNNNLTGQIPTSLLNKPGLDLMTSGNPLLAPPPS